jgi:hypothetical protein
MSKNNIEGTRCPYCDYEFELATGVGHDQPPSSGDMSICIRCGSLGLFTVSDTGVLGVRKPSKDELIDIYQQNPEVYDMQTAPARALLRELRKVRKH